MPESVEMPAPVSTEVRPDPASQPATRSRSTCVIAPIPATVPRQTLGSSGMELTAGLAARVELTVTDADTAQALGSGDVPVLGTPKVLALMEAASVVATAARLEPGLTTVGTRVELDHRAATPVGRKVVAE